MRRRMVDSNIISFLLYTMLGYGTSNTYFFPIQRNLNSNLTVGAMGRREPRLRTCCNETVNFFETKIVPPPRKTRRGKKMVKQFMELLNERRIFGGIERD